MDAFKDRFVSHFGRSCFLFGPRGTGKSTWLHHTYPEAACIDLLDAQSLRTYSSRPERLRDFAETYRSRRLIVIDEIQRVPALLPVVHMLIEDLRDVKFIMTGSTARKLRREGLDLLGGRASVRTMHPFMAAELGDGFSLEESLVNGMVPLIVHEVDRADALQAYVDVYVQQEIRAEGVVRQLDAFNRFLEAMSFSHGCLINATAISRECEVKRTTVDNYIGVLEDMLIGMRLPVFSKRAQRALVTHNKFYFFDCGVFRALRPSGPLDRPEEAAGKALEGLVFQHLRAWCEHRGNDSKLYFWRSHNGHEVDFVIYGPSCFWALEVKNTERPRADDVRSLKIFRSDYPECEPVLLYRGKETIRRDGILWLPVQRFLTRLDPRNMPTLELFL